MQKISRRHTKNKQKINKIVYNIDEALSLLKTVANSKFIETIELHANLNIDPKYSDQQLRSSITLPNGQGSTLKIAVLTSENNVLEAKNAGAQIVEADSIIEDISKGNINFDLLIATPEMMPKLAKLGRILGPKGLMPSPKSGTITTDLTKTIVEFKRGKFEYKADKTGIVHTSLGKSNFSELHLKENLLALYKSIEFNRPSGVKGKYFKTLYICTTMGPSIKLDLTTF